MAKHDGARLTVDLGNSRCKLRLWKAEQAKLARGINFEMDGSFCANLDAWLSDLGQLESVALCSVASRPTEQFVIQRLDAFPGFEPDLSHGLELDCEYPETIGMDRLFAARGAFEGVGRSVIVVDCGTALTVDLLIDAKQSDGVKRAVFMGGAIAPGPQLLSRALAQGGARLPYVQVAPDAVALGKHTEAALAAGVAVGLRGAARELVSGLQVAAADRNLPVVLTGGAAAFLTSGTPLASEVIEEPDLIHLGLLAALANRGSARNISR